MTKDASLFFSNKIGVKSCVVLDVTNVGAGICVPHLPVLPLSFELTFDNFRTILVCRLIWRDGDYMGVALKK
jgi:hypothetical protein